MANGKEMKPDHLPDEMLKLLNEHEFILRSFHKIVLTVWDRLDVSHFWKDAIVAVLLKENNCRSCGNYRDILAM
ncbi:unnamed protein product, partial [Choristocarpus tenellus]